MEKLPSEPQIQLRSPEMQEIIGRMPSRIIRWGITVLFLVILALLSISWFIRYPDLLPAKIMITTTPPPVALVARTAGTLALVQKESGIVQSGDVIGFIQSNTLPETVAQFEAALQDSVFFGIAASGMLGDLLPLHNDLLNAQLALTHFNANRVFESQREQLQKQLTTYRKMGLAQSRQVKLAQQELALDKEKYRTDSVLFNQQVTSRIDFNTAKATWLQQQRNARNAEAALLSNEGQLNQLEKQIADLDIQQIEQQQKLSQAVLQARQQAQAQILKWKETYLFIAPAAGRLSYLGFLESGLFVEPGKPYFSIIPEGGALIARAEMPLKGSGKVKVGQSVNIRLENYPFEEFGLLRGSVAAISLLPGEDKYWVTIKLPKQLKTSQNKTLPFKQQLSGTTEIITEDLRLLERFFVQFKEAIKRN
jgi:multidrug efflux pump subunit AcrA (membrane-fusion protein)